MKHARQSRDKRRLKSEISPPATSPLCPGCGSKRIWKDGVRSTRHGDVQRYLCRSCGFRFSFPQTPDKINVLPKSVERLEPGTDLAHSRICDADLSLKKGLNRSSFPVRKDIASHEITGVGKDLNVFPSYNSKRRVCVTEAEGTKNLAKMETRQKQAAGATPKLSETEVKGKLIEFLWWMKKQGYKESTMRGRYYAVLSLFRRGADLYDPENVKEIIAIQETWCDGRKAIVALAYDCFLRMEGLAWDKPRYKRSDTIPFIPMETEIDQLIAGASKRMATFLQGLKDTGADPGELWHTEWTDIDKHNRTVRINHPVKGHDARIVPISRKWLAMLERLPRTSPRAFNGLLRTQIQNLARQRKRIARRTENPRLLKITFTTLRHWRGTMEYHKTKDIIHVKQLLGHKNIRNTMKYINLEQAIFRVSSDEFHVKVAKTLDEACKLLEVGFQYVTDMDGGKIFRKRK